MDYISGGMDIYLKERTLQELEEWVTKQGEPSYRAKQIFLALHQQNMEDVASITSLPLSLRKRWEKELNPLHLKKRKKLRGGDGTEKFLFQLQDGELVETVYLPHEKRKSLCISSQVGCAFGCTFCATGQEGFKRHLRAYEIMEQVYAVEREENLSITHLLFMGMGEPLANLKEVLRALYILNHPFGHGISQRRMVISTSGLVPGIYQLAQEELGIVLSISLHASTNKKRNMVMPINKRYPIEDVLAACHHYYAKTKRRLTFEYILIRGFNDSLEDAKKLGELLKGLNSHLNLIPCNRTGSNFSPPGQKQVTAFYEDLKKRGYSVTLRESRGQDIMAACGQLIGSFTHNTY